MRNHLNIARMVVKKPKIANTGKTVIKDKFSYTNGGNVNCYRCYGKVYGSSFLEKIKIGTGEMTYGLRTFATLPEDKDSFLVPTYWLKPIYNSNPRGIQTLPTWRHT